MHVTIARVKCVISNVHHGSVLSYIRVDNGLLIDCVKYCKSQVHSQDALNDLCMKTSSLDRQYITCATEMHKISTAKLDTGPDHP